MIPVAWCATRQALLLPPLLLLLVVDILRCGARRALGAPRFSPAPPPLLSFVGLCARWIDLQLCWLVAALHRLGYRRVRRPLSYPSHCRLLSLPPPLVPLSLPPPLTATPSHTPLTADPSHVRLQPPVPYGLQPPWQQLHPHATRQVLVSGPVITRSLPLARAVVTLLTCGLAPPSFVDATLLDFSSLLAATVRDAALPRLEALPEAATVGGRGCNPQPCVPPLEPIPTPSPSPSPYP